jgi:hypothetical protein
MAILLASETISLSLHTNWRCGYQLIIGVLQLRWGQFCCLNMQLMESDRDLEGLNW